MTRRFTVLILFLALSSPPTAVASVDGMCMTAKSLSSSQTPDSNAHACCSTADVPETCDAGPLAMSCCSLEQAPYQETRTGALPAYAPVLSDLLDLSIPLRGFQVVEPAIRTSRISPEMDTGRSPPPLRVLFCTYLI